MLLLIEAKKDAKGLPLPLLGFDDSVEIYTGGSVRFIHQTPDLLQNEFGVIICELSSSALKVVLPEIPAAGGFLPPSKTPKAAISSKTGFLLNALTVNWSSSHHLPKVRPSWWWDSYLTLSPSDDSLPRNPLPVNKPNT